jgi:hypothetical protein
VPGVTGACSRHGVPFGLAVVGIVVVAGLTAACERNERGRDGAAQPSAEPTAGQTELDPAYARAVDQQCGDLAERVEELFGPAVQDGSVSAAEFSGRYADALDAYGETLDAVDSLDGAETDRRLVRDAVTVPLREVVYRGRALLPRLAASGPDALEDELVAVGELERAARAAARGLGLVECGREP